MMIASNEATARRHAGKIQSYRPMGAMQNPFVGSGCRMLSTRRPPLFPVACAPICNHLETDFRGVLQPRHASWKARLLGALLAVAAVAALMIGLTFRVEGPNTLLATFGLPVARTDAENTVKDRVPPVRKGRLSSGFGPRWGRMHQGVDIAARYGEPIHALADGRIIHSGWEAGYGRSIVIDHGHGLQTRYAHCARLRVPVGATVTHDAWIADVGATGHATGPHLHLEVLVNGIHKNPVGYYRMGPVLPSSTSAPPSESQLAKSESELPLLAWLGRSGRNVQSAFLAWLPHTGQPGKI